MKGKVVIAADALHKLKVKEGRRTKPEAEPQKPWMPCLLAGGGMLPCQSVSPWLQAGPAPLTLHCGWREPG